MHDADARSMPVYASNESLKPSLSFRRCRFPRGQVGHPHGPLRLHGFHIRRPHRGRARNLTCVL